MNIEGREGQKGPEQKRGGSANIAKFGDRGLMGKWQAHSKLKKELSSSDLERLKGKKKGNMSPRGQQDVTDERNVKS